jgi:hypothetical protein
MARGTLGSVASLLATTLYQGNHSDYAKMFSETDIFIMSF